MSEEQSAVLGATGTIKTLADGTFRVQIDIEPRFAQAAFALFGAPGTPVALARITNEAAVAHDRAQQQEPEPAPAEYGQHYAVLYRTGWFHNPKVIAAFKVDRDLPPEERIDAIKFSVYEATGRLSLTGIAPARFADYCEHLGIRATLPAAFFAP